jgi:hypothetical protein
VAYGAAFEKNVMAKLANAFPHHADSIKTLIDQVWDQIVIFRDFYKDPGFGKSTSLKSVLPVVVPHLSYAELEVGNGAEAQSVWAKMIHMPDGEKKEKMVHNLRAYCHLDTLAMVEIHRVLTQYQA